MDMMEKIKIQNSKIKRLGNLYTAVVIVLLVAMFNPFTAVMVALFFVTCFLLVRAIKEIGVKSLFYEEDKEY